MKLFLMAVLSQVLLATGNCQQLVLPQQQTANIITKLLSTTEVLASHSMPVTSTEVNFVVKINGDP